METSENILHFPVPSKDPTYLDFRDSELFLRRVLSRPSHVGTLLSTDPYHIAGKQSRPSSLITTKVCACVYEMFVPVSFVTCVRVRSVKSQLHVVRDNYYHCCIFWVLPQGEGGRESKVGGISIPRGDTKLYPCCESEASDPASP